jgi:hypothetical protein
VFEILNLKMAMQVFRPNVISIMPEKDRKSSVEAHMG